MIRINLLAAEKPQQKKRSAAAPGSIQAYAILGVFAGGAALACGGAFLYLSNEIKAVDAEIAAAEERQRKLEEIKKQVEDLERKRENYKRKVELIETLKAQQSGPVHMLDEISKGLPEFVWLTTMEATKSVALQGQSSSMSAVADFMTNLNRSGWFPAVDLRSAVLVGTGGIDIYNFALEAQFQDPELAKREAAAKAAAATPAKK